MHPYKELQTFIVSNMPKEYHCHLQFVHKISLSLQKEKGGDLHIIEATSIAHDIGRPVCKKTEDHAERGASLIIPHLQIFGYSPTQIRSISHCISMHNKYKNFKSIEEEIIMNADVASKILYHDAFMLMTKKENYKERAIWGMRYLGKIQFITFPDLYKKCYDIYQQKKEMYTAVLQDKSPDN